MSRRMGVSLLAGASLAALMLSAAGARAQQRVAAADTSSGATAVEEVVVTAQRKREAAQTVPIAISAFSAKSLQVQKIEGGPDLLKAIPNVSFTKTNFSGYNLTIRGIGTQAISAATDPGVSVNFNGTALIRNRLFEQEFLDVERVEVLRGPQGTLYGRNATAGAVNVISAKPTGIFEGELKGEVGTYGDRRVSGFLNLPVIGDKLDVRVAGSWTKRDGFSFNSITGDAIDGRDLYTFRTTVGFKPNDRIKAYFVWEHFNEDDNRTRSTKQLCTHDPGLSSIGGLTITDPVARAFTSQGCQNATLYSQDAYGTPNGLSIPFLLGGSLAGQLGFAPGRHGPLVTLINPIDPYGNLMQSPSLREIASQFDPVYRARSDVLEFNADWQIADHLTLTSQTAYNQDHYFSQEDYNRFNTVPGIFNDSQGLKSILGGVPAPNITPGGVYCDPQLGCSSSIVGLDQSSANSRQWSQEFRLSSSFDGPLNFSVGGNYLYYKTLENYYVFFNVLSALAQARGIGNYSADLTHCNSPLTGQQVTVTPTSNFGCIYIDPNPLDKINTLGHNYYVNINPYRVSSTAGFGEVYYKLTPKVKFTAGFRYTDDNKTLTPIPTQVLLSSFTGGTTDGGFPVQPDLKLHWGAVTGRFGVDWTPDLSFTSQTLIYAFYNRGYKGGGQNPPGIGYATEGPGGGPPLIIPTAFPPTFQPEYVNAFEVGAKNTLLGGRLVLNGDAFFYDYKGYQVSQIESNTAINENFNAHIWGAELESVFNATRHLRFNATFGYQGSRLADGSKSIDVMDRTQGNPDYIVFKPNPLAPNNCVVSAAYVAYEIEQSRASGQGDQSRFPSICPGTFLSITPPPPFDPAQVFPNGGVGFFADLSGHELPNQPHTTVSFGADYTLDLPAGWNATLHGDIYHQASSWARVYQDPIDRLNAWTNINLSLVVARPASGLQVEVYVKNLLNSSPITGAFINSDNTALTTNVFTLDPRIIGGILTKRF
ncbi:MAG: TonB-dependent receptor [Caulobacteraceae bacterium]|nr:TonB-dependent receptor [Caulobacteraceae bacterium]